MGPKRWGWIILCILALVWSLWFFYSDKIIARYISVSYRLDASYKSVVNKNFREFVFDNLKLMDNKKGTGILAKSANLKTRSSSKFFGDMIFDMTNVRFIRKNKTGPASPSNDLTGLITTPFKDNWNYNKVSGAIRSIKGGMHIEDLVALSEDIKLSFNGDIYDNDTIDGKIRVFFSKKLADKMFGGFAQAALDEGTDGWRSFSADIKGDYKGPSIQVTGKLFRLNIKSVDAAKR